MRKYLLIKAQGLGGAVAPPGYFRAMKDVCQRHGALLVMDEVMCGLGRCGTCHAWQHPDTNTVPDLQTVGKTLGGGYVPVAALLIGRQVAEAMEDRHEQVMARTCLSAHADCTADSSSTARRMKTILWHPLQL